MQEMLVSAVKCVRIEKWTNEDSTPSPVIAMKVQT